MKSGDKKQGLYAHQLRLSCLECGMEIYIPSCNGDESFANEVRNTYHRWHKRSECIRAALRQQEGKT